MSEPGDQNLMWPGSIDCFDLTLSSNAENLALDEALLSAVELNPSRACLRFWQPLQYFVVLGRSNRAESEVNTDVCLKEGIPILRRASGGGTVLVGPGCLCFSLVLPIGEIHRQLGISSVTAELMSRTASGLRSILPNVEVSGTSDLVQNGWKFSGNAQRWLRHSFIHHGTLLFDFDLLLLERCLNHPSREPAYRKSRRHREFVKNIEGNPDDLRRGLSSIWNAVPAECPAEFLAEATSIAAAKNESSDWLISPRPDWPITAIHGDSTTSAGG